MGNLINAFMLGSAPPPSDSFNRADSSTVLGVTDVGGLAYTQGGGVSRTWGIDGNKAYLAAANGAGVHDYYIDLDIAMSDNYTVTTAVSGNQSDIQPAIFARGTYIIRCARSSGSDYLWCYRGGTYLGGNELYLPGDSYGIKVAGTTIDFLKNGTSFLQVTGQTTNQTNTHVGLWVTGNSWNGANPTTVRFDYLNVTTP